MIVTLIVKARTPSAATICSRPSTPPRQERDRRPREHSAKCPPCQGGDVSSAVSGLSGRPQSVAVAAYRRHDVLQAESRRLPPATRRESDRGGAARPRFPRADRHPAGRRSRRLRRWCAPWLRCARDGRQPRLSSSASVGQDVGDLDERVRHHLDGSGRSDARAWACAARRSARKRAAVEDRSAVDLGPEVIGRRVEREDRAGGQRLLREPGDEIDIGIEIPPWRHRPARCRRGGRPRPRGCPGGCRTSDGGQRDRVWSPAGVKALNAKSGAVHVAGAWPTRPASSWRAWASCCCTGGARAWSVSSCARPPRAGGARFAARRLGGAHDLDGGAGRRR